MELSVIVPVYNAEKTLCATLDSLLAQAPLSYSWEIIAVDDGSTDASLTILQEYQEKASKYGIVFHVFSYPNGGVGSCRNRGLEKANGNSILYLDADDHLHKGALQYAMDKKCLHDAAIFVFDSEILYQDGTTAPFPMSSSPTGKMSVEDYMLSHPCPWNKIIDKKIFTENNLSFEEGILYEDLALIPALGNFTKGKIYYDKTVLHSYFQSGGSIMRSNWSEKRLDVFRALDALRKNTAQNQTQTEYLCWHHLYRNFVWLCFDANKIKEMRLAGAYMRKNYPSWQKNPLILKHTTKKERLAALLFHKNLIGLVRLWKGVCR